MAKYIDADRLRAEIENRMEKHWEGLPDSDSPEDDWTHTELCVLGAFKELEHIEYFLNSLQQEQPEVDLESEIDAASKRFPEVSFAKLSRIAKRFFELGQKDAYENEIEYIRKDTLLEWVAEKMNYSLEEADNSGDRFDYGSAAGFGAVVDKIKSL